MSAPREPKRVVIGVNNTAGAEDALVIGSWIARSTGDVPLVVAVYAEEPLSVLPGIGSEWVKEMRDTAEDELSRAGRILGDGPAAEFRAVGAASSASGLDAVTETVDASMIVIGSTAHGVRRRVASGHTANRLFHGASVPVLIAPRGIRDHPLAALRSVGCAFVPTPEGCHALRQAVELARRAEAQLDVFTVVARAAEHPAKNMPMKKADLPKARTQLSASVEKAVAEITDGVPITVHLLDGDPVNALAALDEGDCQVLVCGSRGYGPLRRVLLGGVSGRLVRRAACPVMVVPRGAS